MSPKNHLTLAAIIINIHIQGKTIKIRNNTPKPVNTTFITDIPYVKIKQYIPYQNADPNNTTGTNLITVGKNPNIPFTNIYGFTNNEINKGIINITNTPNIIITGNQFHAKYLINSSIINPPLDSN